MIRLLLLLVLGFALPGRGEDGIDLSRPVSESVAPDRLYWNFDDGPRNPVFSGCVVDHSPSHYHGRLYPGDFNAEPTWTAGRFGSALYLEGAAMPYRDRNGTLRVRNNPKVVWRLVDTPEAWEVDRLNLDNTSFTAGLWIRVDRSREGESQSITLMSRGQPQEPGRWGFYLSKDAGARWSLRFNRLASRLRTEAFNDGAWHHVALAVDAPGKEVTFWLDGETLGDPVPMPEPLPPPEDEGRAGILSVGENLIGAIDDLFVTSGLYHFTAFSPEPSKP